MNRKKFRLLLVLAAVLLALTAGCAAEELPRDAGCMAAYIGEDGLMLYRFDDDSHTLLHQGRYLAEPVFSPEGGYVYFRGGSDTFCAPLDGSRVLLAAKNAEYVCSDGEAAIFRSLTEGVTRFDPVNGESTALIAQPETGYIGAVSVSPDRSRAVYTVCADDIGRTQLLSICVTVPGASDPDEYAASMFARNAAVEPVAWTPDGSTCVLAVTESSSETRSLMLFSVMDGALSDFSGRIPQITANGELSISADGNTLIAPTFRSSSDLFESLFVLDLTDRTYSYLSGGYAPMLGCAISADGDVAAYSLGESDTTAYGIFVNSNGKTLLICGGDGTSYVCPSFFADGQELYFLDTFEGKIALCRAYANSSGASELFAGIVEPDGVYCKTLRDTFSLYDTTGRTDEATEP